MKKIKLISVLSFFFALLFAAPSSTWALSSFTSESGFLVLPEVVVNENTFLDSVTLKLNFATNTFEVVNFAEKPSTIHQNPINSVTQQDIKMDLLDCARTTRTQVTCHLMLTSLGGVDTELTV